jgi:hypothetical protein
MRRLKILVAGLMTVAALVATSAVPALALQYEGGPVGPICQLFLTNGEQGYYLHSADGGSGYYAPVYGWHMWCQSPDSPDGWYVQN